jgi:hypothetical protein
MAGDMHSYQIDDNLRTRIFIVSAILSVVAARLLYLIILQLPFSLPWWIETPSVLGFFGIFVWLFDNYLWKIGIVHQTKWFFIPNLNSAWVVEIKSSHKGFEETVEARAIIRQTASKICIALETTLSHSRSIYAALMRTERLNTFELTYLYVNEPKADSIATMNIHQGTACLRISDDCKVLEGEYYSGRGRQTFGRIIFRRTDQR